MKQLYPDLWQTGPEQPYDAIPGLITRAYLLATGQGNMLIYSCASEDELRQIESLGGVKRQYLSHVDEAGPAIARIRALFDAELWCHAVEAAAVARKSGVSPDGTFERDETHFGRLEIMPLPGHTPGSSCFLYRSPHGKSYLFTGDTLGLDDNGNWQVGYIPGVSDKEALLATLSALGELQPDVVISSAFGEPYPVREVNPAEWKGALANVAKQFASRSTR